MSKVFELEQLRKQLMNPELPSGLYLLDTDLTDEEIEGHIKELGCCSYMKESLFLPNKSNQPFAGLHLHMVKACIVRLLAFR